MDYGVMLKKQFTNPSRKSRHHYRQSPFEGSQRQIRGKIIKYLLTKPYASESTLSDYLGLSSKKVRPILQQLVKEEILQQNELGYTIRKK
jgi:A/G-specific adenine glycosylase